MVSLESTIAEHTNQHVVNIFIMFITNRHKCQRCRVVEIHVNVFIESLSHFECPFAAHRMRCLFFAIVYMTEGDLAILLEQIFIFFVIGIVSRCIRITLCLRWFGQALLVGWTVSTTIHMPEACIAQTTIHGQFLFI